MVEQTLSRLNIHSEKRHDEPRSDAAVRADRGVPADIMMPRVLLVVASFPACARGLVMVFSATVENH